VAADAACAAEVNAGRTAFKPPVRPGVERCPAARVDGSAATRRLQQPALGRALECITKQPVRMRRGCAGAERRRNPGWRVSVPLAFRSIDAQSQRIKATAGLCAMGRIVDNPSM